MIFRAKTFANCGTGFSAPRHPSRHHALAHVPALPGFGSLHQCLDKIVLSHRRNGEDSREDLLGSIMRAVENNGQVTLPVTRGYGRGWKITASIAVVLAGIGALAVAIFR